MHRFFICLDMAGSPLACVHRNTRTPLWTPCSRTVSFALTHTVCEDRPAMYPSPDPTVSRSVLPQRFSAMLGTDVFLYRLSYLDSFTARTLHRVNTSLCGLFGFWTDLVFKHGQTFCGPIWTKSPRGRSAKSAAVHATYENAGTSQPVSVNIVFMDVSPDDNPVAWTRMPFHNRHCHVWVSLISAVDDSGFGQSLEPRPNKCV